MSPIAHAADDFKCSPEQRRGESHFLHLKKTAAFVFVNYDDAEDAIALYAKRVLLRYENGEAFKFLSADQKNREAFLERLQSALETNDAVDLFFFGHGGFDSEIRTLDAIPPRLRKKIRLVYNSGCSSTKNAEYFIKKDVGSYVSHRGYSMSPLFVHPFLDAWFSGWKLKDAVTAGNAFTGIAINQMGTMAMLIQRATAPDKNLTTAEIANGTMAEVVGDAEVRFDSRCWEPPRLQRTDSQLQGMLEMPHENQNSIKSYLIPIPEFQMVPDAQSADAGGAQ